MDTSQYLLGAAVAAGSVAVGLSLCCNTAGGLRRSGSQDFLTGQRARALVYADKGAGERSVATLVAALRSHGLAVREIRAVDVLAGGWQQNCDLFCMPGGADLPYCKLLNGRGNDLIVKFTSNPPVACHLSANFERFSRGIF